MIRATYPAAEGVARVEAVYGSGERGFADGPAATARFHSSRGMAFDAEAGRLYVADAGNHAIREVDIDTGDVATVAGTGVLGDELTGGRVGSAQALQWPLDVAIDRKLARLYVAMGGSNQIWQIELKSRIASRLAGDGVEGVVDGPAAKARLARHAAIARGRERVGAGDDVG